jgi:ankyrin repeat protein
LWKAAHNNHFESVVLLLDKKAVVNAANSDGITPLFAALMGTGDNKMIEKLIESGM